MEAILFIGIQGSGKSSFNKERFFNTHVRFNLDMLKTKHYHPEVSSQSQNELSA